MSIQFRIVENAPLPAKEQKARKVREKRDFSKVPVGGAAAFPVGDSDPKKLKASIYQSAANYRKENPGFQFKVSIEKNEDTGAAEIWVRRLASTSDEGNGGSPATVASEIAPFEASSEGWGGLTSAHAVAAE